MASSRTISQDEPMFVFYNFNEHDEMIQSFKWDVGLILHPYTWLDKKHWKEIGCREFDLGEWGSPSTFCKLR